MRRPAPFAIIPALLLCGAVFYQRANSQTKPARNDISASIAGKVTIKGKPAPGVVVALRPTQSGEFDPTFKGATDQDGNYRIREVPTGSYEILPIAPALVSGDVDNARGRTVIITEAEDITGIDFDLVRGGVITGRVTDADGHPVVEERVNLLPLDQQQSNRGQDYTYSLRFRTDDRGIYRIFGIRPGRYKVSVGQGNITYVGSGVIRPSFRTTFHPDATDPAKAVIVDVDEGTEATGINISLAPPGQGFNVKGQVVDESGKGFANATIGLSRISVINANSTSSSGLSFGVRSDSQGEFRFEKLPPGKYMIMVYPGSESELRADSVTFDVVDQDVTGLLIKCSNGASLTGLVVLAGVRDKSAVARLFQSYVYINVNVNDESLHTSSGRGVQTNSDGSFRIGGLQPGTANFSFGGDGTRGFTISRIERDGVAQPNGVQIRNGEQVYGISLVLAYNTGSIRGAIKLENGSLPAGGRLFIQLTKAGESEAFVAQSLTDMRGHFLFEGLSAGDYEVNVQAYIPGSQKRPAAAKQTVSVADGAATEVNLTIDLASTSNP